MLIDTLSRTRECITVMQENVGRQEQSRKRDRRAAGLYDWRRHDNNSRQDKRGYDDCHLCKGVLINSEVCCYCSEKKVHNPVGWMLSIVHRVQAAPLET